MIRMLLTFAVLGAVGGSTNLAMAQDRRAETHGGDASSSQAKLDTRIGGLCRQTRVTNALAGCAATRNVGMDRMAATPAAMGLAPASVLATRVLKVIRSVPATRVVKVIRSDLATGAGADRRRVVDSNALPTPLPTSWLCRVAAWRVACAKANIAVRDHPTRQGFGYFGHARVASAQERSGQSRVLPLMKVRVWSRCVARRRGSRKIHALTSRKV